MRAVDTNVLVRLLARDDAAQVARAEAFVAPGAWISVVVLVEAVWVLKAVYGVEPAAIVRGLERLLDHRTLVVEDAEIVAAAVAVFEARPALGFSDCLVVEIARRAGHLPLGTFDRRLAKLPDTERL